MECNDISLLLCPFSILHAETLSNQASFFLFLWHHAMHQFYAERDVLVDASNAFNTINRQAALHNIKSICLCTSVPDPVRLQSDASSVHCDKEIISSEGTTQGAWSSSHGHVCLCCLMPIKWSRSQYLRWPSWEIWDSLQKHGDSFGYHPNAANTL